MEGFEQNQEHGPGNADEAVIHNFGVFRVDLQCPQSLPSPAGLLDWPAVDILRQKDGGIDNATRSLVPAEVHSTLPSPNASDEGAFDFDSCNATYDHGSFPAINDTDTGTSNDADDDSSSLVLSCQKINTPITLAFGDDQHSFEGSASWLSTRHSLPRCLEPQIVPREERFLMDHYRNRVVNLFCVIDNRKSPWKTIHLPLVLQSAGELSFGAETTKIRHALRFALYAISGFYLANEHRNAVRSNEASHWHNIASRYRGEAIKLLAEALKCDLYSHHRPRYKEFLATMLSMITINVSSSLRFPFQ